MTTHLPLGVKTPVYVKTLATSVIVAETRLTDDPADDIYPQPLPPVVLAGQYH